MTELLIFGGLLGMGFGLVNLIRPTGKLQVTTRKRGAFVIGASFLVVALGAAAGPPADDSTVPAQAAGTMATTSTSSLPPGSSVPQSSTTTVPPTTAVSADPIFAPPMHTASGDPSAPPPDGSAQGTVLEIIDGDTIEVRLDNGSAETVRLIGINSPESGECFAEEASVVLQALTPVGGEISMTADQTDRDQYGRLLRYVWLGGFSVNQELVRRGAAIARRYPPNTAMADRLDSAQEEAQVEAMGLWRPDACGPFAGTEVTVVAIEADSPGDDNQSLEQELVRIRNDGAIALDMTGWTLKDESSTNRFPFPPGFVLAPGALVTVHTGCGDDDSDDLYWCSDGAVWNNDGDTAFVVDHNGNIMHFLEYGPQSTATESSPLTTPPPATTVGGEASGACHPSYTGACVPIASDVDCESGSGDGPEYVGRVAVVGPDEYGLDRDGDGLGCEDS